MIIQEKSCQIQKLKKTHTKQKYLFLLKLDQIKQDYKKKIASLQQQNETSQRLIKGQNKQISNLKHELTTLKQKLISQIIQHQQEEDKSQPSQSLNLLKIQKLRKEMQRTKSQQSLKEWLKIVSQKEEQIRILNEETTSLKSQLSQLQQENTVLNIQNDQQNQKVEHLLSQLQKLSNQKRNLQQQNTKVNGQISSLQQQIKELEEQRKSLQNQKSFHLVVIEELNKELKKVLFEEFLQPDEQTQNTIYKQLQKIFSNQSFQKYYSINLYSQTNDFLPFHKWFQQSGVTLSPKGWYLHLPQKVLTEDNRTQIQQLFKSQPLAHLQHISIVSNTSSIQYINQKCIDDRMWNLIDQNASHLQNLKILQLQNHKITSLSSQSLQKFPHLQFLDFRTYLKSISDLNIANYKKTHQEIKKYSQNHPLVRIFITTPKGQQQQWWKGQVIKFPEIKF